MTDIATRPKPGLLRAVLKATGVAPDAWPEAFLDWTFVRLIDVRSSDSSDDGSVSKCECGQHTKLQNHITFHNAGVDHDIIVGSDCIHRFFPPELGAVTDSAYKVHRGTHGVCDTCRTQKTIAHFSHSKYICTACVQDALDLEEYLAAPPAGPPTIPYGKHKGLTVAQVPDGYKDWLASQVCSFTESRSRMLPFAIEARASLAELGGTRKVGFGKHADLTYAQLLEGEKKYAVWAVGAATTSRSSSVKAFAAWAASRI